MKESGRCIRIRPLVSFFPGSCDVTAGSFRLSPPRQLRRLPSQHRRSLRRQSRYRLWPRLRLHSRRCLPQQHCLRRQRPALRPHARRRSVQRPRSALRRSDSPRFGAAVLAAPSYSASEHLARSDPYRPCRSAFRSRVATVPNLTWHLCRSTCPSHAVHRYAAWRLQSAPCAARSPWLVDRCGSPSV